MNERERERERWGEGGGGEEGNSSLCKKSCCTILYNGALYPILRLHTHHYTYGAIHCSTLCIATLFLQQKEVTVWLSEQPSLLS